MAYVFNYFIHNYFSPPWLKKVTVGEIRISSQIPKNNKNKKKIVDFINSKG